MAAVKNKPAEPTAELSVEEKLRFLYMLQQVDSKIDRIRMLRGELPLEVQDLEDEIEGLETRIDNLKQEIKSLESEVSAKKQEIKDANTLIKKYQEQQKTVRKKRECD